MKNETHKWTVRGVTKCIPTASNSWLVSAVRQDDACWWPFFYGHSQNMNSVVLLQNNFTFIREKKITLKKLWSTVHRVFPPLDHARRDFLFCCLRILILSYYIHGDGTNFWQLTMNWSFKYSNSLVCSLIEMSRYALLRTGIVRFYRLQ